MSEKLCEKCQEVWDDSCWEKTRSSEIRVNPPGYLHCHHGGNFMNLEELIKQKIDSYKDDFDFRLEAFIFDLTERIAKRMKERNISRSKLAEILEGSPPAVTKILNGNSNFTLKTLLSLADALDLELKIEFIEKKAICGEKLP